MVRGAKMAHNWFRASQVVIFCSTSRKCSPKRSASFLPVSSMYLFFWHSVQVMQQMTTVEMQVNRSLMLMDCLGPEILLAFSMKRQVLYRGCVYLKGQRQNGEDASQPAAWHFNLLNHSTHNVIIFPYCKENTESYKNLEQKCNWAPMESTNASYSTIFYIYSNHHFPPIAWLLHPPYI